MPPIGFPPEFERRGIEGWAVVRFDIAPWGGVGNVAVVAAEPAAAFGQQAVQIVGAARKAPSARGYTGCMARVLFKLPVSGDPAQLLGP
jgi:TonB family protein